MKVCICYESKTGNTKMLADVICETYSGTLVEDPAQADVVFLGSWTDRGSCAEPVREIAARLHHKRVFLFGTCGFGGSQTYYDQIFQRTAALLPPDNVVIGRFYCQGKMPEVVKKRYLAALRQDPENSQVRAALENFGQALSHPDQADLQHLREALHTLALS